MESVFYIYCMHLRLYVFSAPLIAGILTCATVEAQKAYRGIVVDSLTSAPVPYATLKVKSRPMGAYADENGNYELRVNKSDSVIISSIGYASVKTVLAEIDTIRLTPISNLLDEIIVSDNHSSIICGISEKKFGLSLGARIGFEYTLKIDLPDTISRFLINKVIILTNRKIHANNQKVRLMIYDVTDIGYPGSSLLNSQLLLDRNTLKNKSIDVSHLGIITKNQVFVGVEWIGSVGEVVDSSLAIRCTYTRKKAMTYYRTVWQPDYAWSIFSHDVFKVSEDHTNPPNLIISIEVESVH